MMAFVAMASIRLPGILRATRPAVAIVFFSFPCGPLGLLGKLLLGVPYVVSLRGGDVPGTEPGLAWLHMVLKPFRRAVLRNSFAVVANSEGLRKLAERADPFRMDVISNGVDTVFFAPPKISPPDDRPFTLLFVGRFQPQKNLFFLLDQLAALASAGESFVLHVVGDGPQRAALIEHARRVRLDDRIRWFGWSSKEELLDRYQRADCLVNPSLYEGMPNVVLEAMACGLPVLASRVAGNDAVVRSGETGYLFELDQPDTFRVALKQLIRDRPTAGRFGKNAREWARRQFSWDAVAIQYLSLIERRTQADQRHAV
jgi:glycosyltransferase involved in cell wall biosynthesis